VYPPLALAVLIAAAVNAKIKATIRNDLKEFLFFKIVRD
jgi:hypothetical protein